MQLSELHRGAWHLQTQHFNFLIVIWKTLSVVQVYPKLCKVQKAQQRTKTKRHRKSNSTKIWHARDILIDNQLRLIWKQIDRVAFWSRNPVTAWCFKATTIINGPAVCTEVWYCGSVLNPSMHANYACLSIQFEVNLWRHQENSGDTTRKQAQGLTLVKFWSAKGAEIVLTTLRVPARMLALTSVIEVIACTFNRDVVFAQSQWRKTKIKPPEHGNRIWFRFNVHHCWSSPWKPPCGRTASNRSWPSSFSTVPPAWQVSTFIFAMPSFATSIENRLIHPRGNKTRALQTNFGFL